MKKILFTAIGLLLILMLALPVPTGAVSFRVFYGLTGNAAGDLDRQNNDTCSAASWSTAI